MDIKVNKHTVIVFDLDDTLYNELDFLKSAYKEIALHLEPTEWRQLYVKMFSMYRSRMNVFEFLSQEYPIAISELMEMYHHHKPTIKLFDGVLDMLKTIKKHHGQIGIITDGRTVTQREKLESLGLLNYIDQIIISEEFGSEKPNIANFKAIEDNLKGMSYYYIADNLKKDFIGPNALSWNTIALIDNGKNIHFESYKYRDEYSYPESFIFDFTEINII
ncbi:HAD-IA family hydrolase [Gelidibacter sp. F2691]|nr:HAD-IA family hydrolase [Gelidibacter sp. F2691]